MTLQRGRSFDELQRAAAKRLLQTAVVIDDRLVTDESPAEGKATVTEGVALSVSDPQTEPPAAALPPVVEREDDVPSSPRVGRARDGDDRADPTREPDSGHGSQAIAGDEVGTEDPVREEAQAHSGEGSNAPAADTQINVKVMADAFAEQGLACGILKPEGEPDALSRIVAVASRADIVVLDWFLAEDSGARARDAIGEIVRSRGLGRQLIAVYTTQRNLGAIEDELRKHLGVATSGVVSGSGETDSADEALGFDVGGRWIVVLNKGGVATLSPDRATQISEADLPAFLVDRYAELSRGLVPAAALHALAATRDNVHRLLERLGAPLDVGFGGHLLRVEHLDDGQQHLIDAIAGELRAIIDDDAELRAAAGEEGVAAWLDERASSNHLSARLEVIEELLDVNVGDGRADDTFRNKYREELGPIREEDYSRLLGPEGEDAEARRSDAEFAMLLSLRRSVPGAVVPTLRLGGIVREDRDGGRYWLCVQPVCDSVRLDGPTRFPFLRLESVPQAETGQRFSLVVPGADDGDPPVHLWAATKPRDVYSVLFEAAASGEVEFSQYENGLFVETADGERLKWVAQLKPVHAQRVAEGIGRELGRVGLAESEWLRLRGRKGKAPSDSTLPPGG